MKSRECTKPPSNDFVNILQLPYSGQSTALQFHVAPVLMLSLEDHNCLLPRRITGYIEGNLFYASRQCVHDPTALIGVLVPRDFIVAHREG